jgi:hypothetical protein
MWKSAGRAPSLWVLPWHLPYNWGKNTENLSQGKKNLSHVKKNLSQNTVYIHGIQLKSGPYFNISNLFTNIYNMLYYT